MFNQVRPSKKDTEDNTIYYHFPNGFLSELFMYGTKLLFSECLMRYNVDSKCGMSPLALRPYISKSDK
jgi:hypothetical protein